MTSKLTREWLQHQISAIEAVGITDSNTLAAFKLALAAMDSEPVVQPVMFIDGDISSDDADKLAKIIREFNEEDERPLAKMAPLYRHAQQPVVPDDVQRDAKRWRALLGSARIRIIGSAGFDATAHPGENPDYRHFGMEIWTHYPNWLHEKNEYGIDTLTQYADAMLAAAPQSPGSEPATAPGKWIPVSERMPEDSGRYWCYVEEQNDLGKSHYQWNCSWNGDRWWVESEGGGIVTNWMPLPAAPQEEKP